MNISLDWKKGVDLFFTDTVQRRTILIVQLLLLALLAATLAGLTWRLLADGEAQVAAPPLPRPAAAPAQGGAGGRNWNIAQWHLFGAKPQQASAQPVEALPETRLNLVLRGVIASGNDEGSGAIIGAPNGVEAFYPLKASLPGGAVLRDVFPDRVVLERGGRLETLRLPREGLDGAAAPPASAAGLPQGAVSAPPIAQEPGAAQPELTLSQYRDLALSNPQQLADVVRVAPRNDGGRFLGYEVQPGRDPALLNRLGLIPGDVVTSVNGIGLDTPARALGILRSLTGSDEVRIEVQRDGVAQTLFVNIQQ